MDKWKTKTLGEVTSYIAKGIPPKYVEKENENTIRVLNQKCNRDFRISYADSRLHDSSLKAVPPEKMLISGDVLINSTGTGTAGRVAQIWDVSVPTTIDGHMILMRPTEEIDVLYYGYAVKAHQQAIESYAEGSTGQTEINKTRLQNEIVIQFPEDKNEQRKIGKLLANLDEKIIENERINKNLEEQAQAIYQEQFGKTEANRVLSDICGYSKERIAVSELTAQSYYSTENMQPNKAGALDATSLPTTPLTTRCKCGDVLISNIRPYFKKIVYCYSECGCSADVICFTPNKPELSAFLFNTLYADNFFDYMVAGSKGTKMPRGDKQQIMTYPVNIPSDSELEAFNGLAVPILKKINANNKENAQLVALRDGLLPRLMSGEIDITTASNI